MLSKLYLKIDREDMTAHAGAGNFHGSKSMLSVVIDQLGPAMLIYPHSRHSRGTIPICRGPVTEPRRSACNLFKIILIVELHPIPEFSPPVMIRPPQIGGL